MIGARAKNATFMLALTTAIGLSFGGQPQEPFRPYWIAEAAAQMQKGPETLANPTAGGNGPAEPNLSPLTLTPQRMQSIGVKTGVVSAQGPDQIRTVGNVGADETALADAKCASQAGFRKSARRPKEGGRASRFSPSTAPNW
jgi:hypothetical protein